MNLARAQLIQRLLLSLLCSALAGCGRQTEAPTPTPPPNAALMAAPEGMAETAQRQPEATEELPPNSSLPTYELQMTANDAFALQRGAFSNETHPATFVAETEVYQGVRVRVRGAFSRSWPKKSLKIIFSHDKTFGGHHALNLNSGWRDPAMVREMLAYAVYAACDAPASQSRMVRLDLNGKFHGIYVEVEQPDKGFLKRFNLKGASVYKALNSTAADERDLGSEQAYRASYDRQNQKTKSYSELEQFCRELQRTANVTDFFNRNVDVEKYVNYLAAGVLTQNWDGYNKNHFLIYDREGSHKWIVVPWDLDRTFGDHWKWSFHEARLPILLGTMHYPGVTGWNRLEDRFLSVPEFRARFLARLSELLEKEFTTDKLFPVLDQLEKQIANEAALDRRLWPAPAPNLHSSISGIKTFIKERRLFLLRELPQLQQGGLRE